MTGNEVSPGLKHVVWTLFFANHRSFVVFWHFRVRDAGFLPALLSCYNSLHSMNITSHYRSFYLFHKKTKRKEEKDESIQFGAVFVIALLAILFSFARWFVFRRPPTRHTRPFHSASKRSFKMTETRTTPPHRRRRHCRRCRHLASQTIRTSATTKRKTTPSWSPISPPI